MRNVTTSPRVGSVSQSEMLTGLQEWFSKKFFPVVKVVTTRVTLHTPPQPMIPVKEQMVPDPDFPTVKFPNPEEGKSALDLSFKTANENNSTVILANDPDADRLAVAEKQPKWVCSSQKTVLIAGVMCELSYCPTESFYASINQSFSIVSQLVSHGKGTVDDVGYGYVSSWFCHCILAYLHYCWADKDGECVFVHASVNTWNGHIEIEVWTIHPETKLHDHVHKSRSKMKCF